jgi:hypothetical protein
MIRRAVVKLGVEDNFSNGDEPFLLAKAGLLRKYRKKL